MTTHERAITPDPPPEAAAAIVEALPFSLIDTPLDYIFADHFRQRSVCVALKRFAEHGRVPRSEADMVTAFLDRELSLHHEDEDQDLFPAVRRRALPEDDLGAVLARLSRTTGSPMAWSASLSERCPRQLAPKRSSSHVRLAR